MVFTQAKQGFTLIELLVVVLIIGILAAIALPQYQLAVKKSRYAVIKPILNNLAKAEESYFLANGKYTIKFDKLDIDMPSGKLENSTDSSYRYSWGGCWFDGTEENPLQISCELQDTGPAYKYVFYNKNYYCVAMGTKPTTLAHKVCQSETKNTGQIGTYWITWEY